jgi:glycosyltransferase involved in cell wall biosynthesis
MTGVPTLCLALRASAPRQRVDRSPSGTRGSQTCSSAEAYPSFLLGGVIICSGRGGFVIQSLAIVMSHGVSLVIFRKSLIEELVARNIEVYALAPDYSPQSKAAVVAMGAVPIDFSMRRTGLNPLMDFKTLMDLVRLLRRLNPDVVSSYSTKSVIYGTIAARFAGVQARHAMVEGLGFAFTETTGRGGWQRRLLRVIAALLYRNALRVASSVTFLNPEDRDLFIKARIVEEKKAHLVCGIGVDLQEWKALPAHCNPVSFTLTARLLREKGVAEFVEAAKRIRRTHPEVRFVLLGEIDSNPGGYSEGEVNAWVAAGWVEWPGYVDVRPWLAQTSVFVLPSYREGLPRSTQEAMAMGRAVITTAVPGCRETVVEGVNGFMVPPRDVASLVERMMRFIEEPALIAKMGAASRKLAEERFDVRGINAQLLSRMGVGTSG